MEEGRGHNQQCYNKFLEWPKWKNFKVQYGEINTKTEDKVVLCPEYTNDDNG